MSAGRSSSSACSARASAARASAASTSSGSATSSSAATAGVSALQVAGSVSSTTPDGGTMRDWQRAGNMMCAPPPPLSLGPLLVCASSSLASYATKANEPSICGRVFVLPMHNHLSIVGRTACWFTHQGFQHSESHSNMKMLFCELLQVTKCYN